MDSRYYYTDPQEHLHLRVGFLDAVRRFAPEVLSSLRDQVHPLDSLEKFQILEGWAQAHRLYNSESRTGLWFLLAAWKTLWDWRDRPELLDSLQWAELTGPDVSQDWQNRLI